MSSVSKNFAAVLPFLWKEKTLRHKIAVLLAIVLVFLTISLNLSVPIIFKKIVNALAAYHAKHYEYALMLLIAYGVCWTAGRFFEKMREMAFYRPMSTAVTDYSLEVFKHIHSLSLKFHLGRQTGKVAGAIQRAQLSLAMLVTTLFFRIVPVFIEALLAFFILWHSVGIHISVVVIVVIAAYLIMNYLIMGLYKKSSKEYSDMDANVDKRVVDSLLNAENIKYLGAEDFESKCANRYLRKREDAIIKLFWVGTFTTVFQAILLGAGLTIINYLVGVKVLSGSLKVGDFVLVNGYLLLLFNPLESIAGFIRMVISNSEQLDHSLSFIARIP